MPSAFDQFESYIRRQTAIICGNAPLAKERIVASENYVSPRFKIGNSTWGHPQPEVILPSLIPLVFERFLPILTLWLSPNSPKQSQPVLDTTIVTQVNVAMNVGQGEEGLPAVNAAPPNRESRGAKYV